MNVKKIIKTFSCMLVPVFLPLYAHPQSSSSNTRAAVPALSGIKIFQDAYPDLVFEKRFDAKKDDWIVTVTFPGGSEKKEFRWAGGSMLPEQEVPNKERYWPLLYSYPAKLSDPVDFTPEETERMRNFGSTDNRKNGAGTPMFFFDTLYDSGTRGELESHLSRTTFLGHSTTVHERIVGPLKTVERRITELAASDAEVRDFVDGIKSTDAYYWRIISGTTRKSFHSLGIAIDILPKYLGGKAIFWGWTKDVNPDGWMLTPLSARWMPPQKVIDIFEEEGFIWGGKWTIFDNMHFEYHPELILYSRRRGSD